MNYNYLLFILIILSTYYIFYFNETKNNINDKVFNKDGTEKTIYPHKDKCYFDQKILYPQLNIIDENSNIIMEELLDVKNKDPKLWHEWIENQLSLIPL